MCSTFNIPTSLHHITSYYINISENDPSISPSPKLFPGKKTQQFVGFSPLTSPSLIKSTSRCPKVRNPWSSVQIRGGPYHPPWKLKKGQARISSPHLCGHRNPAEVEIPAPQSTTMFWHCWSWMYLAIPAAPVLKRGLWMLGFEIWSADSEFTAGWLTLVIKHYSH